MRFPKVALFTHRFLEPTHYAIAQLLRGMSSYGYRFAVFAKRFIDFRDFERVNIVDRQRYSRGPVPGLSTGGFSLCHAIFDDKVVLRAYPEARSAGLPFVLSFHGGFDTQAKIFDPRYKKEVVRIAREVEAVTVVTVADSHKLQRLGVDRVIDILPVPIDADIIPDRVGPDPNLLVAVGRFIPKKGTDLAIRCLTFLPNTYRLIAVGGGRLEAELRRLAITLGVADRVEFPGLLSLRETLSVMAGAGVLLHPGRVANDGNAEGTPQTVLWAQAMGLPVVTTPTGGLTDVVEDGLSGLLVEPENPVALAAAIQRLKDDVDLYMEVSRQARFRVLERHRLSSVTRQLRDIYSRSAYGIEL